MYLPPDDVHIHQTQTILPHGPLENGIGGENVNLPTFGLGYLT